MPIWIFPDITMLSYLYFWQVLENKFVILRKIISGSKFVDKINAMKEIYIKKLIIMIKIKKSFTIYNSLL